MNFLSNISNLINKFSIKSAPRQNLDLLGYRFLNSVGWHDVKATLAWQYWAQVHAIWRAVNLISQDFSSLPAVVTNLKTKEIYKEYDPRIPATFPLKVLIKPNEDKTYKEFMYSQSASLLVTGETYIKSAGLKLEDIKLLFWQQPQEIEVISDGFYMPKKIIVNEATGSTSYERNEEDKRYYAPDGIQQIYQIIDFNPFYTYGNQRGFSRLSSIYFAIEEYIKGNTTNINTLKKGNRISGVLTLDDVSGNNQIQEIKKQLKEFYSGETAEDNILVMNKGRNFHPVNITNKDMEYSKLNEMAKQNIYEIFEIPSSFYSVKASSFNNKLNDRINLFIFATIPLSIKLFEEYTKFFYKDTKFEDQYALTFIIKDIPALELMFDEANLRKSQSGVFTFNELRESYGLEDIGTEGDVIYQPLNLVPVGQPVEEQKSYKKDNIENAIDAINKSE